MQDVDSSRSGGLRLQIKRSYQSEQLRQPDTTPSIDIIDLTHTPTDTSPPEELQGFTIDDLDTARNQLATTDNMAANSTAFPVSIPTPTEPSASVAPSSTPPMTIPSSRSIRFRSRVRITSGVHHKNPLRPPPSPNPLTNSESSLHLNGRLDASEGEVAASSCSSSPSSSISAPIRFREDESTVSKWGPLGQRVRLFVSQQKSKQIQPDSKVSRNREARRRPHLIHGSEVNDTSDPSHSEDSSSRMHERTPLLDSRGGQRQPHKRPSFADDDDSDIHDDLESYTEYQSRLDHEIDMVFGKWPGRLLNHHWWWWNIQPIVCCSYSDEWEDF
ncbi:hypothetical protein BT96DRAFT_66893 [Gymnopus androsaceus JB14]|uniref:Uncharacterized protein n=1 Tax=Gymnopus androsaceus JB14 TaxID=1447944 RepID=A0A6A4HHY3_9AGAR|nr:hypothetical protein BT96DRAFT_66893 [Gymnopus androsaceus JB14]